MGRTGIRLALDCFDGSGNWQTNVALTGDGTHALVAKDADAAGNTGVSGSVTYTLDTPPPVVAITSTGGLTNHPTQTISGTVDMADAGTVVTVFDGTSSLGTATVDGSGNWHTNVTLSGDGTHTLSPRTPTAPATPGSAARSPIRSTRRRRSSRSRALAG